MKNFDIENIERKNIYKTPEGFFENIQHSVLNDIEQKAPVKAPKAKIFPLNWTYAAAASVILFFGIIGFIQFNESTNPGVVSEESEIIATNSPEDSQKTQLPGNTAEINSQIRNKEIAAIEKEENNSEKSLAGINSGRRTEPQMKIHNTAKRANPANTELQLDQMIKEMPTAEFADMSRGTEQDVYLDLYN